MVLLKNDTNTSESDAVFINFDLVCDVVPPFISKFDKYHWLPRHLIMITHDIYRDVILMINLKKNNN